MHSLTEIYKGEIEKYHSLKDKLLSLMGELLTHYDVKYHKIECRAKNIESLENKIKAKDEKYKALNEITDLVGVRIITYFEDEVDLVEKVINTEFLVDLENSLDKRILEDDKFGYRSLHKVVNINTKRTDLPEYERFKDIPFEIQIRSILQHAWAEIEHDLGYKGEQEIPKDYKRIFYRAAAALESVDVNFTEIRDGLKNYESGIVAKMLTEQEDPSIDINQTTLTHFIKHNSVLNSINNILVHDFNTEITSIDKSLTREIMRLHFFNIYTILELEKTLKNIGSKFINFVVEFFSTRSVYGRTYSSSIGIFLLGYYLAVQNSDKKILKEYLKKFKIGENHSTDFSKQLVEIYNKSLITK